MADNVTSALLGGLVPVRSPYATEFCVASVPRPVTLVLAMVFSSVTVPFMDNPDPSHFRYWVEFPMWNLYLFASATSLPNQNHAVVSAYVVFAQYICPVTDTFWENRFATFIWFAVIVFVNIFPPSM